MQFQDQLLATLQNDVLHKDMKAAATDAANIIRRDTDLSNPANTAKNLQRDGAALVQAGMSQDTLEKLGILPKAELKLPANGDGAVITDGKTSMPIKAEDVLKSLTNSSDDPNNHGKRTDGPTEKIGGKTVQKFSYEDGWTGETVGSPDGTCRTTEKSPDGKSSYAAVENPDGMRVIQSIKDGKMTQVVVYPKNSDGSQYTELTTDDGKTHKFVENYHGLKWAPIIFDGDMKAVQNKYQTNVNDGKRSLDSQRAQFQAAGPS